MNYSLLSDENDKVRKLFGVKAALGGTIQGRVIYVVDKTGKIINICESMTNADKHIEEALKVLNPAN